MPWLNLAGLPPKTYTCGWCGKVIATASGFQTQANLPNVQFVYICPFCDKPTIFEEKGQTPGVAPGVEVTHLPPDIETMYREARNCVAIASYTSAVLSCRKLLMHVAVAQGAPVGESFVEYVDHLATAGFVPPNGRGWVDHIRKKGNEANHEIRLMTQSDAEDLISFAEMLLKFIYEFPRRVPGAVP
ncbi:MAG TPA: DUF4145 domain-containing protein [Thermoanaerobaculia bacterium]|nr:DUF4145 domain-containing protein [Thermoanaerobaculia bacterium]